MEGIMKTKLFKIIMFLLLFLFSGRLARAEEMRLVSYYPSPKGIYRVLSVVGEEGESVSMDVVNNYSLMCIGVPLNLNPATPVEALVEIGGLADANDPLVTVNQITLYAGDDDGNNDCAVFAEGSVFGVLGRGGDIGVRGVAESHDTTIGVGVHGYATTDSGGTLDCYGVRGEGKYAGGATAAVAYGGYFTGDYCGVKGDTPDGNGYGVVGESVVTAGVFGSSQVSYGVYGTTNTGTGVYAECYGANDALQARNNGTGGGILGASSVSYGVKGTSNTSYGVHGISNGTGGTAIAVCGESTDGVGVKGESETDYGVLAESNSNYAVRAESNSTADVYAAGSGVIRLRPRANTPPESDSQDGDLCFAGGQLQIFANNQWHVVGP